jgi:hypothetical protein
MTTYTGAIDLIFDRINDNWAAAWTAVSLSPTPELRWQGQTKVALPGVNKYWGRVSQQTIFRSQGSMSSSPDALYWVRGIVYVEVFGPRTSTVSLEKIRSVIQKLKIDCFKTSVGGVSFYNVSPSERPPDEGWYSMLLSAEYRYAERS